MFAGFQDPAILFTCYFWIHGSFARDEIRRSWFWHLPQHRVFLVTCGQFCCCVGLILCTCGCEVRCIHVCAYLGSYVECWMSSELQLSLILEETKGGNDRSRVPNSVIYSFCMANNSLLVTNEVMRRAVSIHSVWLHFQWTVRLCTRCIYFHLEIFHFHLVDQPLF